MFTITVQLPSSQEKLGSCEDPLRPRLTMEEEMELNPEIFTKIDKEIMDGEWTTTNGNGAAPVDGQPSD